MLSFAAEYPARTLVPSFTVETVLLPSPPKKPAPAMVTVTGLRFVPLLGVTLLMDGAGVVTVYLSAETVTLVPPSAVTVISYVPIGVPAGITTPSILLSFIAVIGVRE